MKLFFNKIPKELILSIICTLFLLSLIIGATLAYFYTPTTISTKTINVNHQIASLGLVTFKSGDNILLNLSREQLMDKGKNTIYYGTSNGASTIKTSEKMAVASTDSDGIFKCDYKLNLTAEGDMYEKLQQMPNKSDNQIVMTINGVEYDFVTSNMFPLTITGTIVNITKDNPQEVEIELKFVNRYDIDQSALAETSLTLKINAEEFNCTQIQDEVYVAMNTYAIYSKTDNSLRFYNNNDVVEENSEYNNLEVTEIYRGFDSVQYYSADDVPWHNNRINIKKVIVENVIQPFSTAYWFSDQENVTSMNLKKLDTSQVKYMSYMFNGMTNLSSLDVSNFNTKNVINMQDMFEAMTNLKELDLSNFNTSNVKKMNNMFNGLENVTLLNVSNFNTSNVTEMNGMFSKVKKLKTLDVSSFDTNKVQYMSSMFKEMESLTKLDLSNFYTHQVVQMSSMFSGMTNLESISVIHFDTDKVQNMSSLFSRLEKLTELDLSSFDTSLVTNMSEMFYGCDSLTHIFVSDNWDTNAVTNSNNMFYHNIHLVGENGTLYNSNIIDKTYARIDREDTPGYFTYKEAPQD